MAWWIFLFVVVGASVFWLDHRKLMRQRAEKRDAENGGAHSSAGSEDLLQARLLATVTRDGRRQEPVTTAPAQSAMSDQAILFRQHFPPREKAMSYWGGVPLVPHDFVWPSFTTPDGVERPLHFVMQIDCAAIEGAQELGLPEQGLLYFFVDLDWGVFWEHRVIYASGDPRSFRPAVVPSNLPHAYGDRGVWRWVRRDEDWPYLLPRWSFDPVTIGGAKLPKPADEDEEYERRFWPGAIDLAGSLEQIEGAIVPLRYYSSSYDDEKILVRPFANFPHDWNAVRIAMGEIADQSRQGHIDRFVKRGDLTQEEGDAFKSALKSAIDQWTTRADAFEPFAPLSTADSDAVWGLFLRFQTTTLFAIRETVNQSINATLSASPDAAKILSEDALALVRSSHALGTRGENGVHINPPDHMLGAPSYVQGDAEERLGEWRLLFEISSNDPIGHLFGEGVYQFWIRPEDLAALRFDRVELDGSAY